MRVIYTPKKFGDRSLRTLEEAIEIIEEYEDQGYDLTLRQLFYQFVARGLCPNKQSEYKRLGSLMNNARLAGLVSWTSITDRTRSAYGRGHYRSPSHFMRHVVHHYCQDLWEGQEYYVEVWVEKEALASVISRAAMETDVTYFPCRGYVSASEMHAAAMRIAGACADGGELVRTPVILHLGDHDPSGIDMTRDIQERLDLFLSGQGAKVDAAFDEDPFVHNGIDFGIQVERIALNMDQIRKFRPPPNPAKLSDSRASDYVSIYGDQSWELDALDPTTLEKLVVENVRSYCNMELWRKHQKVERTRREELIAKARDV